jgi:hypothetical protein
MNFRISESLDVRNLSFAVFAAIFTIRLDSSPDNARRDSGRNPEIPNSLNPKILDSVLGGTGLEPVTAGV